VTEGARERGREAGGMRIPSASWLAWSLCGLVTVRRSLLAPGVGIAVDRSRLVHTATEGMGFVAGTGHLRRRAHRRARSWRTHRLAEGKYREKVRGWVNEVIAEVLASDELKNKMSHEFQDRFKLQGAKAWIETEFKHRDDSKSWRDALEDTLQRAYEAKHKSGLEEAVRK
jgi:hypothetical protein